PSVYPLSLHDALPICRERDDHRQRLVRVVRLRGGGQLGRERGEGAQNACEDVKCLHALSPCTSIEARSSSDAASHDRIGPSHARSEEHTSELQSPCNL